MKKQENLRKMSRKSYFFAFLALFVLIFTPSALADITHYYPMEEGSGTTITDYVSTLDLTADTDTTFSSDVPSYNNSGDGDAYSIGMAANACLYGQDLIVMGSDFSESYWFKRGATGASAGGALSNVWSGTTGDRYGLYFDTSDNLQFYDSAWTTVKTISDTTNWYHVVVVHDRSEADAFVYINGVLEYTDTTVSWSDDGTPYRLGAFTDACSANPINMEFDELRIYDHALTETEILKLYNNGTNTDYTTGLETYYEMEDTTDSHSNKDLTNYGAVSGATGKIGNGYDFDDPNDYMSPGDYFDVGTGDFTFSDWVYIQTLPAAGFIHLAKGDQSTGTGGIYDMRVHTDDKPWGRMFGGTWDDAKSTETVSASNWYNIVFQREGTTIRLFVNGELKGTGTSSANVDNSRIFTLGARDNAGTYDAGCDCIIDEVGIWNRSLTAEEIVELYNLGDGLSYDNLTGATPAAPSTPTATERLQQDSSIEQNNTVTINSISYVPVMSSSITITDDTWLYGSATVPIDPTASNTATCRLTVDGAELNDTETSRSLTAGAAGNMLITSRQHYLTAATYDFGLECYRTGGGAFDVDNSSILLHILTTPSGTQLETAQLNLTSAALPGLLGSTSITTSDNYTASGLERFLVTEWAANYEYTADGNISVVTELAGVNCTEVKRYGSNGATGSVGGVCYTGVGNTTNATSYDFKVFGTGSGSITNAKFHVKEFILHPGEINQTNLSTLTGDGNIANINVTVNGGHSTPDIIAQAILSAVSTSGSQTGTFYLTADSQNSTFVSRTSSEGEPGVLGIQKDIETVSGTVPVTLVGDCALCTFTGQNLLAFVTSDVAATPNAFTVTAKTVYGDTLSAFSINLSDGREFSTTTGSISVPAVNGTLNITIPENSGATIPYFGNTSLDHNVSLDIQLNVTAYTVINVSGNATVSNFTVNGTSTTNGKVYLRLFNDTYNLSLTDATDDNGAEYANTNATVTASDYLEYYTFTPKYSNTINISFYDEETGVLIQPETVYLEAISDSQSGNYSTTTGTITQNFLLPDTYTLRYNSVGYADSFYYITIEDRSFNELNLTLLNISSASNVTLTVYDTLGNTLEMATVKVLKYDIGTNAYNTVEILNTNFEGVTVANIVLNSEYYKFIIDYDGQTRLTTTPTYIYGTTLTFYVPIASTGMEDFFNEAEISGTITHSPTTNLVTFTYSDLDNAATQGCLYAYTRTLGVNTLVNSTCTASPSGSLNLYVFNSSNTWYLEGKVTKGGVEHLISTYRVDFETKLSETGSGAFFAFILLAVLVFIGLFSLEVAVVLASAVPLLFSLTKLASFDYVISIPILLLGLVTAFIIGSNKQ